MKSFPGASTEIKATRGTARKAGILYLIVVLTGFFSLGYVPSQVTVAGDAAATVNRIMAAESLFRLGVVAGVICYTAFLLLPLVLYPLLKPVSKSAAILMVAFATVSVPISFVNLLNRLDILSLLSGADYLRAFTAEQVNAQVMLLLGAYRNGNLILKIFWGLWLLPFGYLVFKSGFLPKILGLLLMIGCAGYLVEFFGSVLALDYAKGGVGKFLRLPAAAGEIGICLWLLILGTNPKTASEGAATSAGL